MLARALYDNTADFADELTFKRGDTLVVIERELSGAPGWWLCSFGGRQGIVPANRLQLIAVRDQDENTNGSTQNLTLQRNRGYFYKPPNGGSAVAISPASSSLSPLQAPPPPAYSESDPSPSLLLQSSSDAEQLEGENTYENFTSAESENLYEDPTVWDRPTAGGDSTPTMLKQTRVYTVRQPTDSTTTATHLSPTGGLLVTTTAHHRVGGASSEAAYQASSTDSGVYSQPPSNRSNVGDYAEDIYDYPAAFQQMQQKFEHFNVQQQQQKQQLSQDGVYDTVPGQMFNQQGDYDFVQLSPNRGAAGVAFQQQFQQGEYDALPSQIPYHHQPPLPPLPTSHMTMQQQLDTISLKSEPSIVPLGQQHVPSESTETLPEFSPAECEKAFENRRNVIERLVRYEHACTRAASRWAKLFNTSGWKKSGYLVTNAYPIRSTGEQLAHSMSTFAAFAAAALTRLDFPTFATVGNLRNAYQPCYIEATNFKKYLTSVGLVNWTLENATPHLAKTFEVMLYSQRTFLTNMTQFSNILKRADFNTITTTAGSMVNLSAIEPQQSQPSPKPPPAVSSQTPQLQHRTYMVVKDVQTPASPSHHPPQSSVPEVPSTPRQTQRGVSTVHIDIHQPSPSPSPSPAIVTVNTLGRNSNQPTGQQQHHHHHHQNKSLRFAEDVELVSQLAGDLDQRTGELSFVISTFVLSLRRTQPGVGKMSDFSQQGDQHFHGGFIECGKLLVNVAHSVVILGDKLTSAVSEPDRSEAIKTSTDRLRVCIRVFVEKLKNLAGAGSRSTSAVDDLITHVEVLRSQAESIKHRLGTVSSPNQPHQQQPPSDSHQSLSTPTATLSR